MNIRQYTHKTYIPYHSVEINVQKPIYKTNFWGYKTVVDYEWKKENTRVDSKWVTETRLEFLNPATLKWEPLPSVSEETEIASSQMKGLEGGYIYAR